LRPRTCKYRRKPGGARKPKAARTVFEAIVYVLRTGCQWKALPKGALRQRERHP
jgi:transposase